MTTKPETKFWKRIKNNASKITWTRLEAVTPAGLPDLLGFFNDSKKGPLDIWTELKVTKGKRIKLSPGQISWHMNRFKLGGKSFILANPLPRGGILVYSGGRTLDLATSGLSLEPCAFFPEPCVWIDLESWLIDKS